MKKLLLIGLSFALAATAVAGKRSPVRAMAGSDEEPETTGKEAKIVVDQFPKLGKACRLTGPSISGSSMIGAVYAKPRQWIVLEAKYTTFVKWQDQLTVTWHVLLETKSATEKSKEDQAELAPYSYFTTSVTYANIPRGSHAASVCLHPSYLERFGEAKAVGIVISNKKGDVLFGDVVSEVKGIPSHPKSLDDCFWQNNAIMNATDKSGAPMIERRQGLLDRSKTIWSLVNPNDYELVIQ